MAKRRQLHFWRVSRAEPFGLNVWFDPSRERLRLYDVDPGEEAGVPAVPEFDDDDSRADSIQLTMLT